jgi:two-component system nitrate/nitrite response regulator NarL
MQDSPGRSDIPSNPPTLRVLVAARDPLARAELAALLADEPGHTIAGQVGADRQGELADAIDFYRPEVVVVDLGWSSAEAIAGLAEPAELGLPILALVPDAATARDALQAGARGILPRDLPSGDLVIALAAVARGLYVIHPDFAPGTAMDRASGDGIDGFELSLGFRGSGVSRDIAAGPDAPRATPALVEPLTARELEVLRLLAEGLTNKAIAHRLAISENTVKFHVNAILGKLGAASRTEATMIGARLGLVPM